MNQELQEKLDLYRKQLDKLFRTSRLLSSDSQEEKERIYGALCPPCDRLPLYRYYKFSLTFLLYNINVSQRLSLISR